MIIYDEVCFYKMIQTRTLFAQVYLRTGCTGQSMYLSIAHFFADWVSVELITHILINQSLNELN